MKLLDRARARVFQAVLAVSVLLGAAHPAASGFSLHLTPVGGTAAPQGFTGACSRHSWVCRRHRGKAISESGLMALVRETNRTVNRRIRPASDIQLNGIEDYWSLPGKAGDCEDYALLKMKLLLDAGVSSDRLMLATAFTRRLEHHVVLIVRTQQEDLVLDNLTRSVRSWRSTGYTFLKMQDPVQKARWNAILVGPHAKRTSS